MFSKSQRGFTLIEIIVVIVILSIVSAISIKFLADSLRIYTMTVNQKTLLDEGKLSLERMCRDIRDAKAITASTASSITFTRTHATNPTAGDSADESIRFDLSGTTLRKVKNAGGAPENPIVMADNVNTFTVTRGADDEITLALNLLLGTGENVALQTKVYPKNLTDNATYKSFSNNWQEEIGT